jgi:hypothetical protein
MGCNSCKKEKKKSTTVQFIEKVQDKVNEYIASDEEQVSRMNTCERCSYFSSSGLSPRCLQCGCFLDAKTRLKMSKCPIDKW